MRLKQVHFQPPPTTAGGGQTGGEADSACWDSTGYHGDVDRHCGEVTGTTPCVLPRQPVGRGGHQGLAGEWVPTCCRH